MMDVEAEPVELLGGQALPAFMIAWIQNMENWKNVLEEASSFYSCNNLRFVVT